MAESVTQGPIVVGIDGSASSLAALRWALREGVATGAAVEVIHGWEPNTLSDLVFEPRHALACSSACMLENEIRAALLEFVEKPVVTQVSAPGRPATILLEHAAHAAMLVIGARHQPAMRDLFRGPVGHTVRRRATCPLVIVDRDHTVTWRSPHHYEAASV